MWDPMFRYWINSMFSISVWWHELNEFYFIFFPAVHHGRPAEIFWSGRLITWFVCEFRMMWLSEQNLHIIFGAKMVIWNTDIYNLNLQKQMSIVNKRQQTMEWQACGGQPGQPGQPRQPNSTSAASERERERPLMGEQIKRWSKVCAAHPPTTQFGS